MFKVMNKTIFTDNNIITSHSNNTYKRYNVYKDLLSTEFIDCFVVDKNHPNGLEVHCINENGLIYIYNKLSGKLITVLHARKGQIDRYYNSLKLTKTKKIKDIIKINKKRNTDHKLNNV